MSSQPFEVIIPNQSVHITNAIGSDNNFNYEYTWSSDSIVLPALYKPTVETGYVSKDLTNNTYSMYLTDGVITGSSETEFLISSSIHRKPEYDTEGLIAYSLNIVQKFECVLNQHEKKVGNCYRYNAISIDDVSVVNGNPHYFKMIICEEGRWKVPISKDNGSLWGYERLP